jgi:hypothetical protein
VSLSTRKVFKALSNDFECGWRNIRDEPYAGTSSTHKRTVQAVSTTNCAGHHNVQMFFMTPRGRVLHCLPGFWGPEALLKEIQLAKDLFKIYRNEKLSRVEKNSRFLDRHLEHALAHDAKTQRASHLQGFDVHAMRKRKGSDFRRGKHGMKGTDQVVHERMAERPFVSFKSFDIAAFVDMGLKAFDSHSDGCSREALPAPVTQQPALLLPGPRCEPTAIVSTKVDAKTPVHPK